MEEPYLRKYSKGTESDSRLLLKWVIKKGRQVIGYIRKRLRKKLQVVAKDDNNIIMKESTKKHIRGVYANKRMYKNRYKERLGKLGKKIWRVGNILGDENTYLYFVDQVRKIYARGKTMDNYMIGT